MIGLGKFEDLTGQKFGRLTVIKRAPDYVSPKGYRKTQWYCQCSCGNPNLVIASSSNLKKGDVNSCKCLQKEILYEINSKRMKKYNDYEIQEDYVIMYTQKGEPFLVDLEDFWKVKDICWHFNKDGYVCARVRDSKHEKPHNLSLARYIMDCPDNMEVDHKNGSDTLFDNRKSNLRIVTQSQNCMNRKRFKNNKSGVTGVVWNKTKKKFEVSININNKCIYLGLYDDFDDAVDVRMKAEQRYFGEYSPSQRNN